VGIKVQTVIERLTRPVGTIENTVDTLKFGSLDMEVSGIAVTFMPTQHAIQKAVALEANLMVAHEGVFHSHWDRPSYKGSDVMEAKQRLIKESGLAIYRFHDYWHRYRPDGIAEGLVRSLKWEAYVEKKSRTATVLNIPPTTVHTVAEYVKTRLGLDFVRCVGELSMSCRRVGLLVGYRGGGSTAVPLFEEEDLEVLVYGEGPEWETPEYVRDAVFQGRRRALIVLGHAESEEPGMQYLASLMEEMFPSVPIFYIPGQKNFHVV